MSTPFGNSFFGVLHKVFAIKNCKIVHFAQKPAGSQEDGRAKIFIRTKKNKGDYSPLFFVIVIVLLKTILQIKIIPTAHQNFKAPKPKRGIKIAFQSNIKIQPLKQNKPKTRASTRIVMKQPSTKLLLKAPLIHSLILNISFIFITLLLYHIFNHLSSVFYKIFYFIWA